MDLRREHSSSSDILMNLLFLVFVCVTVFCDRLLSNSQKSWNGLEGKKALCNEQYSFPSWHFRERVWEVRQLWANAWGESSVRAHSFFFFFCCIFSKDSFGSTGPSPDAFHVRWLKHVCARLCAGLCEANYSWKQLLSQQLASSPSRVTLL